MRLGVMQRQELHKHSVCPPSRPVHERGGRYDAEEMHCYVDESYVFRLFCGRKARNVGMGGLMIVWRPGSSSPNIVYMQDR